MTETTIVCPNCHHELKLTESLAAPIIEKTRQQFEQRLAVKDQEIAGYGHYQSMPYAVFC